MLSGFSLSGKVVGRNCGESTHSQQLQRGTAGVTIDLVAKKTSQHVAATATNSQGVFVFQNVLPGDYTLRASHPNLTIEQNQKDISFSWNNYLVETPFIISGYHISGSVLSTKEEPVAGVDFLLFSDQVASINCEPVSEALNKQGTECNVIIMIHFE